MRATIKAIRKLSLKEHALPLLIAVTVASCIDLVTNDFITNDYPAKFLWDHNFYIAMVRTDHWLAAPFAYRFATPLAIRALMDVFNVSMETGFRIAAYTGAICQVMGLFYIGKFFKFSMRSTIIAVLATVLYFYNIRFLMFNVYNVDQLSLPLLLLGFIMLLRRNLPMLLIVTVVGLQFREFLIIPAAILVTTNLMGMLKGRLDRKQAMGTTLLFVLTSAAVIIPRLLIDNIEMSFALIEPIEPSSLIRLFTVPFNISRDLNIAYYLTARFMPILLLATPARLSSAWRRIRDYRTVLVLYFLFMIFLVMYGGTDIGRFMTYFHIPLVIILGVMLQDGVPMHEAAFMLIAVIAFNRIFTEIPNSPDALAHFYGGHGDEATMVSLSRFAELLAFWAGAIMFRYLTRWYSLRKAKA